MIPQLEKHFEILLPCVTKLLNFVRQPESQNVSTVRDDRYAYADKGGHPKSSRPFLPPTHEWMRQTLQGVVRDNDKLSTETFSEIWIMSSKKTRPNTLISKPSFMEEVF